MEISDLTFIVLVSGSFFAALCSAAFSAGGAMIVLAVTTTVLPVSAIVPIHSTLLIGSTATRKILFWKYIDWSLAGPFLVGSAVGAFIGARIYIELPETLIATAISTGNADFDLVAWDQLETESAAPWVIVGFLHSLLSTLFAYGAVLHAVILHTSLDRRQIVGTMAGCLFGMSAFKIAGYVVVGFDYSPYLNVIAASVAVAFIGTWLGRKIVDRISESVFRTVYRSLVTVTALRLLYTGLT